MSRRGVRHCLEELADATEYGCDEGIRGHPVGREGLPGQLLPPALPRGRQRDATLQPPALAAEPALLWHHRGGHGHEGALRHGLRRRLRGVHVLDDGGDLRVVCLASRPEPGGRLPHGETAVEHRLRPGAPAGQQRHTADVLRPDGGADLRGPRQLLVPVLGPLPLAHLLDNGLGPDGPRQPGASAGQRPDAATQQGLRPAGRVPLASASQRAAFLRLRGRPAAPGRHALPDVPLDDRPERGGQGRDHRRLRTEALGDVPGGCKEGDGGLRWRGAAHDVRFVHGAEVAGEPADPRLRAGGGLLPRRLPLHVAHDRELLPDEHGHAPGLAVLPSGLPPVEVHQPGRGQPAAVPQHLHDPGHRGRRRLRAPGRMEAGARGAGRQRHSPPGLRDGLQACLLRNAHHNLDDLRGLHLWLLLGNPRRLELLPLRWHRRHL
mmetsp:Transcript_88385/g.274571  ORF Transcript_88385/g.274571 Transcript_88385/m.274571 type:complete len:435 (+) Transcript_88385:660-1964(+)